MTFYSNDVRLYLSIRYSLKNVLSLEVVSRYLATAIHIDNLK